jgi:hypothetical protein
MPLIHSPLRRNFKILGGVTSAITWTLRFNVKAYQQCGQSKTRPESGWKSASLRPRRSSFKKAKLRFIEWRSDVSQRFGGGGGDVAVDVGVKRLPSIASRENSKVEVERDTGTLTRYGSPPKLNCKQIRRMPHLLETNRSVRVETSPSRARVPAD